MPGIRQVSESRCKASVSEGGRLVEKLDVVVQTQDICRKSRTDPIALCDPANPSFNGAALW